MIKRMKSFRRLITLLFSIVTAMLIFSSCSEDGVISPEGVGSESQVVKSNTGPITIVEMSADNQGNLLGLGRLLFFADDLVTRIFGGSLTVGSWQAGYSSITFQPYDLPADTTISFNWIAGSTLEATFEPHGLEFANPVRIDLSYKSANLTPSQINSLQVYYYNEESEEWELIGGTVNTLTKTVTAYITHFSRYALAHG